MTLYLFVEIYPYNNDYTNWRQKNHRKIKYQKRREQDRQKSSLIESLAE